MYGSYKKTGQYLNKENSQQDERVDAISKFSEALHQALKFVEDEVMGLLGNSKGLSVKVDCQSFKTRNNVMVRISNGYGRGKSLPLKWEYEADIFGNGEVKIESDSESGIQATNSREIKYLEQCGSIFSKLAKIDWLKIVRDAKFPVEKDYF